MGTSVASFFHSTPRLPNLPGICSPVLFFDITTYLVYIWSRSWRIAMEMLSPHDCRCFLHLSCFRLFPSTPLHSGFVSYVGLVCVPRRERKKETVYLPPRLQGFYSSNPLKKWQKEIPIQIPSWPLLL